MGLIIVEAELSWRRKVRARMVVDTGATHSVLPEELARRLGVSKSPRRVRVTLADGRKKAMHFGTVLVRLAGREAGDTVLIGPRGTDPLLGVEALEALGLSVDPRSGKLKKTRSHGALLTGLSRQLLRNVA
ncbi:MAG TPA: retroviral-like aspartic protease family protein [Polyangiaceae bacterium]|jgi:clan AA aspartic protease